MTTMSFKSLIDSETSLYIGVGDDGASLTGAWSTHSVQYRNYVSIATDALYSSYQIDYNEPTG
jgi:hypothetical protein